MAIYKVQAPDGRILRIEGPDGAAPDEVLSRAQSMYQPQAAAPLPMSAPQIAPEAVFPGTSPMPVAPPLLNPEQPVLAGDTLRPRNLPANSDMGPFQADPGLDAGFMDTSRNMVRKQYELSGNVMDTGANLIDDTISKAQFGLSRLFMGDEAIDARNAANPQPGTLSVPASNPVSNFLRKQSDQDFTNANIMAGNQFENPVDRSGRVKIEDIFNDPTNIPQIAKFGVETAVESAPEMGMAMIPYAGPLLFGGSQVQGIAEERALNDGRDVRDVTGEDLLTAAPFAAGAASLEKIGIKGLGSKGVNAVSRTAKSTAKETGTEMLQEPVELAGETLGTQNEATGMDYAKRSVAGGLGGATTGATLKGGAETVKAVKDTIGDLNSASYSPFDLGAGTRESPKEKLPQAQQPPSQERQQPAAEQATSAPNIPAAPPEPVAGSSQPATPAQPVVQQPASDPPTAEARPEGAKQPEQTKVPARKKVVTPDGSTEIETEDEVVDLDTLITSDNEKFDANLQPRDRKRATSDLQIQRIASELDPERLSDSRTTDQGAPIVGEDNMVESGNGRTAAIRAAYDNNPESAERYRASLAAKGYSIDGIRRPVLIRRNKTKMSPEERVRFTNLSNKSAIAEMSATEKARADAAQIDDDIIDLHKGGEPDSMDNQEFIRSFIAKVTTGNEAGALIGKDKQLTQEGVKRAKAAMVAKAYNDPDLVENIFESSDPEIKAIGNVLRDRAPEFAQVGAAVRRKEVPERFDITPQLMEAVKIIRNARRDDKRIRDVIEGTNQGLLIEEEKLDPTVEKLVRIMYRPELGRMLSQPTIDKILKQYATLAREQKANDLFGENKLQPSDLLDEAYDRHTSELETSKNGSGSFAFTEAGSAPEAEAAAPAAKPALQDSGESSDTNASRIGKERSKDAPDPDELAKTAGRKFENFATSKGTSPYRTAYVDLGMDPDLMTSKPADEQLQILTKAITDRFGMKIEVDKMMDRRAALDMLHNIYNNLSFLSGVLGLPYKAIGLNGTLGVKLQDKLRGALGSYSPMEKLIRLPKKTNSFIHEWLHAMDDHLLNKFGNISDGSLFSGVVRKDGTINPLDNVQAAFANLMHAVFYDKAMLASIKLDLEAKLERAKTDASKADIQRKLKELESGNYKGINGKNNYYQGSKNFGNGHPYWTSPEEMLARVFEAYSAYKIEQAGGDPASIAKGDMAYLSNVDSRLAQTFPKLAERMVIFEAVDQLMARLSESQILGKEVDKDKPMKIEDMSMLDISEWGYLPPEALPFKQLVKKIIRDQKEAVESWKQMIHGWREKVSEQKIVNKKYPKTQKSMVGWIAGMAFSADRALMHSLEKRYPGAASLRELNDRIFTRLSYGESVVKDEFFEAVRVPITRFKNLISEVQKRNGGKFTKQQLQNIRDIMVSIKDGGTKFEKKVAGELRNLSDKMYDALEDAGVEIGYLRNQGYLKRIYIKRKILLNDTEFLEKAAEVYGLQFDQNVAEIIDDIIAYPAIFVKHLKKMMREKPDSTSLTRKEAKELIAALSGGEATDELKEKLESLLPAVREFYSETAAADWFNRILNGSEKDEFGSDAPSSGFTKKRALPPETEKILQDFLETDPFIVMDHYAEQAGRRIGLAKAKKPKGKLSYDQLIRKLSAEGVSKGDVTQIENIFNELYNDSKEDEGSGQAAARGLLSGMRLLGTLALLDLAAVASLAERMTVVTKTKSVRDAFKVVYYTIDQMIGTKDAKEAEFGIQQLGILYKNYYENDAIATRLGGGGSDPKIIEYIGTQFFAKNGLTMIDNSSRKVIARISISHFKTVAGILLNPRASKANKDFAAQDLKFYGVAEEDLEGFAKWITGGGGTDVKLNNVNDWINSPYGYDLMMAINRFNNQTIQRPTGADTPHYSKNPLGNIMYAVTKFSYSFWENVVKAEASKLDYAYKTHGAAVGAYKSAELLVSLAPLLVVSALVNTMRIAIFDRERWEELDDDDELLSNILKRTVSSSGILGPVVDLFWNTWTGIRYQRDFATSLSGAYISNYLKWAESFGGLFGEMNKESNTREYNFIKESWRTFIAPSIAAALSIAPGGKILTPLEGLGIAGIGSSTLADEVATTAVGPKGEKGGKRKSEPDAKPKEAKEPKMAGE